MKALLFFLLSFHAKATILSQYLSTPDAVSEQRFELAKSEAVFVKRSNFFDPKKNLEIGTYSLSTTKEELSELNEVLINIKAVDELLKKKNKSFNDLSSKNPHEIFFFVDEFRVTKESDLFKDLQQLFSKLKSHELKNFSGIRLSDDFKEITTFEKGIQKKTAPFQFSFHCKEAQAPTVCLFKDLGTLYLSPK